MSVLDSIDQIYPIDDAARYLGVSKSHLAKMRKEGKGPRFQRVNNSICYTKSELDVWKAIHGA